MLFSLNACLSVISIGEGGVEGFPPLRWPRMAAIRESAVLCGLSERWTPLFAGTVDSAVRRTLFLSIHAGEMSFWPIDVERAAGLRASRNLPNVAQKLARASPTKSAITRYCCRCVLAAGARADVTGGTSSSFPGVMGSPMDLALARLIGLCRASVIVADSLHLGLCPADT